jgi:hypothetical protein
MLSAADQLTPQLERLASLFTGGALTEEEFAHAKGSVIEVCKQLAKRAYPRPWGMPAPRPLYGGIRKVSDPSRGSYRCDSALPMDGAGYFPPRSIPSFAHS